MDDLERWKKLSAIAYNAFTTHEEYRAVVFEVYGKQLTGGSMIKYDCPYELTFDKANAGVDLRCLTPFALPKGVPTKVSLGLRTEMECAAQLVGRSGLAAQGLQILGGLIDPSYRGVWQAVLLNTYVEMQFAALDRICQAVFFFPPTIQFLKTPDLSETQRGEKGFGSTGL